MSNIFQAQYPYIRCLTNVSLDANNYEVEISNNIHYPEMSLGFVHFYHKALDNLKEINVKKFENRRKIYLITQDFETQIEFTETQTEQTPTSINLEFNNYLHDNGYSNDVFSSGFMKMWEMNIYFKIIDNGTKPISIYNFGKNNDGSLLQGACFIRSNNKDTYHSIELSNKNNESILSNLYKKSITFSNTNKPTKNSIDLIICDPEINTSNIYAQEQNMLKPFIENIQEALNYQKKDGSLIIKISETYTVVTIKIIEYIKQFYKNSWICKPLVSDAYTTERYIIFTEFKLAKLEKADDNGLKNIVATIHDNEKFHLYDVFLNVPLKQKVKEFYIKLNADFGMMQYMAINKIIVYVAGNNFNGADYNDYYNKQIANAHYYANIFLNESIYKKIHNELDELCKKEITLIE